MVRIVQLLCPDRHCIFAISCEYPEMSDENAIKAAEAIWEQMLQGGVNPWCALCNNRELVFETGQTHFKTMKEAYPHLKEMELRQMATQMRLLAERN